MHFLPLLEAKRDGKALGEAEIGHIVAGFTAGAIPEYQMAAFLMAVYFRGLTPRETAALTLAMRDSGDTLVFPRDSRPLVDKHSTGGVGDKVSLPLAPLLACLGLRVPMISGRGLGITGGSLDKLESIPGFTTGLERERIIDIVQQVGCVICGQTDDMVPADKRIYGLRDATGTVPSIPLIVASILSKKLAEGLEALVLDVKFGAAAFMPSLDRARELGRAMVDLGKQCGVSTRALLTGMNFPLGRAAGNWLEVKETIACLENQGGLTDLTELVLACAAHLLVQSGKSESLEAARAAAAACLASGAPRRKWDQMIAAQGADLPAFYARLAHDHVAASVVDITADRAGYVAGCDARIIGEVVRALGGGRLIQDGVVNPDVGLDGLAKPGERVQAGSLLARLHAADSGQAVAAATQLRGAFSISDAPPLLEPLIGEVLV